VGGNPNLYVIYACKTLYFLLLIFAYVSFIQFVVLTRCGKLSTERESIR